MLVSTLYFDILLHSGFTICQYAYTRYMLTVGMEFDGGGGSGDDDDDGETPEGSCLV